MVERETIDPQQFETRTAQQTQAECEAAVGLAERSLAYLNDGLNLMPAEWTVPSVREGLILQLVTMGYDSLRWAFELGLKGYYVQAYALIRTAWESWLHAAYLHLYPERDVEEWKDYRTRPKPVAMRRAVAERGDTTGALNDDFRSAMNDLADTYAAFAHPSETSLRSTLGKRGDELWLRRGGEFDQTRFLMTANLFCLTAYLLATMTWILLPNETGYREEGETLNTDLAAWRVGSNP